MNPTRLACLTLLLAASRPATPGVTYAINTVAGSDLVAPELVP